MLSPVTNDCELRSQVEAISIKDTFLVCGIDFYTFSEDLQSLTFKLNEKILALSVTLLKEFCTLPFFE